MQCHLYKSSSIKILQRIQIRIAFGVPWNCSKTALKRLCCLEDMKCRNQILNARFNHHLLNLEDRFNIPAFKLWNQSITSAHSIANSWKLENPYYHRIINLNELSAISREIKLIVMKTFLKML